MKTIVITPDLSTNTLDLTKTDKSVSSSCRPPSTASSKSSNYAPIPSCKTIDITDVKHILKTRNVSDQREPPEAGEAAPDGASWRRSTPPVCCDGVHRQHVRR